MESYLRSLGATLDPLSGSFWQITSEIGLALSLSFFVGFVVAWMTVTNVGRPVRIGIFLSFLALLAFSYLSYAAKDFDARARASVAARGEVQLNKNGTHADVRADNPAQAHFWNPQPLKITIIPQTTKKWSPQQRKRATDTIVDTLPGTTRSDVTILNGRYWLKVGTVDRRGDGYLFEATAAFAAQGGGTANGFHGDLKSDLDKTFASKAISPAAFDSVECDDGSQVPPSPERKDCTQTNLAEARAIVGGFESNTAEGEVWAWVTF